jgi:molybdate transport system substrate-binding protein
MNPAKKLFLLSILGVAVLGLLLFFNSKEKSQVVDKNPLVVYCAAGIKQAVDSITKQYEREYGVSVQLQYGGSGTLLSNIRVSKMGDLFIAADESYMTIAKDQNLVDETIALARQTPVIGVLKGNPKNIRTIRDLLRPDVQVALANPDAASIGKLTKQILQKSGEWDALNKHVKVFKPTVNDVANDVKLKAVDAAILWDATASQYPELEVVRLPVLEAAPQQVMAGVLKSARNPTASLRFARYLAAPEKGYAEFKRGGYQSVDGDTWAEVPRLNLFSGAMLRPGIEKTLQEFENREGVEVTTIYNGCGILVSQMKAGERPDAYFACDISFMNQVVDMYFPSVNVSANDMVILVAKGNPLGIRELKDLIRPGIKVGLPGRPKVGLAHPEKSALGKLTETMLKKSGVYDDLMKSKNWVVDSATGDFLVNQLRTGSLDAVVVYRSNGTLVKDSLDMITIDRPEAHAVQPYAVGKNSKYRHLMSRLLNKLQSDGSKEKFESAGFEWMESEK